MGKNKKKYSPEEELVLSIEISDTSSELIMRLETIIKSDIASHKLPTKIETPENKGNAE